MTNQIVHVLVDNFSTTSFTWLNIVVPFLSAVLGSLVGVVGAWLVQEHMFKKRTKHEREMEEDRLKTSENLERQRDYRKKIDALTEYCSEEHHQNLVSLVDGGAVDLQSNQDLLDVCQKVEQKTSRDPLAGLRSKGLKPEESIEFVKWVIPHLNRARSNNCIEYADPKWEIKMIEHFHKRQA